MKTAGQMRQYSGAEWRVENHGTSIILVRTGLAGTIAPEWFQDEYWRKRGRVVGQARGRGAVLFVSHAEQVLALRHYRRGGAAASLTRDRYLWTGLDRTRAFREWRLLLALHSQGLPVPNPVAAQVTRSGLACRNDIITERIADTRSLAAIAVAKDVEGIAWKAIGATLRRFHDHGVEHADLNAHNVLLDTRGRVFLVDFDRGAVRVPGPWAKRNMARLHRSLHKVARESGSRFDEAGWRRLLRAYESRA